MEPDCSRRKTVPVVITELGLRGGGEKLLPGLRGLVTSCSQLAPERFASLVGRGKPGSLGAGLRAFALTSSLGSLLLPSHSPPPAPIPLGLTAKVPSKAHKALQDLVPAVHSLPHLLLSGCLGLIVACTRQADSCLPQGLCTYSLGLDFSSSFSQGLLPHLLPVSAQRSLPQRGCA